MIGRLVLGACCALGAVGLLYLFVLWADALTKTQERKQYR